MIENEKDPIEPVPEEDAIMVEEEPRAKSPWKAFIIERALSRA